MKNKFKPIRLFIGGVLAQFGIIVIYAIICIALIFGCIKVIGMISENIPDDSSIVKEVTNFVLDVKDDIDEVIEERE